MFYLIDIVDFIFFFNTVTAHNGKYMSQLF